MKNRTRLILLSILSAVSALSSLAFCGYRIGFVFVDHEVHFNGFCYLLWALFLVNTICLFFQLRSFLKNQKYFNKPIYIINVVFGVLSFGAAIGFASYQPDEIPNFLQVSVELLPYLCGFYALLFLVFVFPYCHKIFRKITALVLCLAVLSSALAFLLPIKGFQIESAPAVFDTGKDYRIVFSTNRASVGSVTYEYNGESYTVWDTMTGRKNASRVHGVNVPYEHLNNNEYTVEAVRALEDIAYGGWLGKKTALKIDKFAPCPEDDFNMICVTDNHSAKPDWSKLIGKGDLYAFLGDIANGIYSYDAFIDNLIIPAGIMTEGRAPVIFARGNHDHRGNYVPQLLSALGFDEYYYRIRTGKYMFTVLDSGEDKADDNYEYGGYNDYASYRAQQIEWAQDLPKEEGYHVILAHSSTLFDKTEEDVKQMAGIFNDLGADFIICGHSHGTKYVPAQESENGIQFYICGKRDGANDIDFTTMHFNGGKVSAVSEKLSTGENLCEAEILLIENK